MFTDLAVKKKKLVVIEQLDSTALKLLLNFIYSGKIIVTEENVKVLLPAAIQIQLNEVKEVCCEFLQKQLNPTNCLGIKAFADLCGCTRLLKCSELYIQQYFSEVVEADEFLSIESEQVVELISSDTLRVPSEEKVSKVFECVIRWVKHELDSRKYKLPQLMEHVRLALTSEDYIESKVSKEPLLSSYPKCKAHVLETLNVLKKNQSDQLILISKCIRFKPRQPSSLFKVFLVVGGTTSHPGVHITEYYDLKIKRCQFGPTLNKFHDRWALALLKDRFLFGVGGTHSDCPLWSVNVLDLLSESPGWKLTVHMLVKRTKLGVGVINNCLYAVGGSDGTKSFNSAEVYDCSTNVWRMISSMSTRRTRFGVGVQNNLLYAVGGYDYSSRKELNSVECYHPNRNEWTPVAAMSKLRSSVGVVVLDGVLYAVGGNNKKQGVHKSVEAYTPSTGVWTTIADMNLRRQDPGVVALDGLLYAIGGFDGDIVLDSVEVYNPITNTWTMQGSLMNMPRYNAGVVVIDGSPDF